MILSQCDWAKLILSQIDSAKLILSQIDWAKLILNQIDWAELILSQIDWAKLIVSRIDWERMINLLTSRRAQRASPKYKSTCHLVDIQWGQVPSHKETMTNKRTSGCATTTRSMLQQTTKSTSGCATTTSAWSNRRPSPLVVALQPLVHDPIDDQVH